MEMAHAALEMHPSDWVAGDDTVLRSHDKKYKAYAVFSHGFLVRQLFLLVYREYRTV